ncbi:MAG: DUF1653 domain-containing protein [Lachnospiraceae bacterium]|nr:DUF1653 domain-containing protein [Lachnospiraceae bacterium]
MREEPKENQVYKHFKGEYYQVITVARHSETEEKLVIYRNLFSGDRVCARPLEMFMSEVDHEKYPDVKQKWRFTLVTGTGKNVKEDGEKGAGAYVEAAEDNYAEDTAEAQDEAANNMEFLDEFLDADTYEKKLDVFTGMWKSLDEDNIDNVALVMDLELRGDTLEEKYKEILNCLKMKARYESTRLR